ncbi:MAG: TM2 domain-containing protein [bacterium]|jgi:TM2 domain-containing membrane protein YozV
MNYNEILELTKKMNDEQKTLFLIYYTNEKRDNRIAVILSILYGYLGLDRFYVGDMLSGIIKFITFGGFFVWWIIDWFLIYNKVNEYNLKKAKEISAKIISQIY